MKSTKYYLSLIIIITLLSVILVHFKFNDDDRVYEAKLKINIQFPLSFYLENRNLYIAEINNFLHKDKNNFRYLDSIDIFQMKGTEKQILKNFSNLKTGLHQINKKNYDLTIEFYNNQRNYLMKLLKMNMNNSDKYFYSDLRKYIQSSIENISLQKTSNHFENYKHYSDLINNLSRKNISFFSKSKSKSELINVIITIGTILILIVITFQKNFFLKFNNYKK